MLETGSLCVKNLNHVINEVSASVVEAGKLATSIDENARQVNLLALVAAVEAGRAGEKGVGLSAMARKARALAIKSADAVSDTRAHIEYAVTTLESICDISRLTMASHREKQVVA
jgi:methyl-accepting chemotaxis protein